MHIDTFFPSIWPYSPIAGRYKKHTVEKKFINSIIVYRIQLILITYFVYIFYRNLLQPFRLKNSNNYKCIFYIYRYVTIHNRAFEINFHMIKFVIIIIYRHRLRTHHIIIIYLLITLLINGKCSNYIQVPENDQN